MLLIDNKLFSSSVNMKQRAQAVPDINYAVIPSTFQLTFLFTLYYKSAFEKHSAKSFLLNHFKFS